MNTRSHSLSHLTQEDNRTIKLVAFGVLDVALSLHLSEEFYERNHIDFESIASVNDLRFLSEHRELWNEFRLSSDSAQMKFLLQVNRSIVEKIFISFVSLQKIVIPGSDNEFLVDMVNYIIERNWIFLNYENVFENESDFPEMGMKIIINLYKGNNTTQCKSIPLISHTETEIFENETEQIDNKDNEDHKQSKSNTNNNNNNGDNDNNNNDNINNDDETDKENLLLKIPQSAFNTFHYISIDFHSLYLSSTPLHKIFPLSHLSEFYTNLKQTNPSLSIITHFANILPIITTTSHVNSLITILDITDFYLFDKSTAYSLFNFIHIIKTKDTSLSQNDSPSSIPNLPKQKTIPFFTALFERAPFFPKLAIFMDHFTKVTITHFHPSKPTWQTCEYDAQLHPRINHNNINTIHEYKQIVSEHYHSFCVTFYGSFIAKLVLMSSGVVVMKHVYIAYVFGIESVKKVLEIHKNKLEFPHEQKYYIVKLPISKINAFFKEQRVRQKENKFKLDCLNKKNSQLKVYNSLFDTHLNVYFRSDVNRRELQMKGFINRKGFIMYDAMYRDLLRNSTQLKQTVSNKKLLNFIRKLNVGEDIRNKEVNVYDKVKRMNMSTRRKLPPIRSEETLFTTYHRRNSMKQMQNVQYRNKQENSDKGKGDTGKGNEEIESKSGKDGHGGEEVYEDKENICVVEQEEKGNTDDDNKKNTEEYQDKENECEVKQEEKDEKECMN